MAGGQLASDQQGFVTPDSGNLKIFVVLQELSGAKTANAPSVPEGLRSESWTGQPLAREARLTRGEDTHCIVLCDLPASADLPVSVQPARWYGIQLAPGQAGSPTNAEALLCVMMSVAPRYEEEFNAWYSTEHIPALSRVPGVIAARRFGSVSGAPRYLALYHLEESSVCQGRAWIEAAETPWTHHLRPHTTDRLRYMFRTRTELPRHGSE